MVWASIVALALMQAPVPTADQLQQMVQSQQDEWDREHMPAGFDKDVWRYMTQDQQLHVEASIETEPRPISTDTQEAAVNMVKGMLKDADSAKFHDIKRRGALDYCGWVNAKNSFGGYVGDSIFFATHNWTVILPADASKPSFCAP